VGAGQADIVRYLIPEFTGLGDIIQKTPMIKGIRDVDPGAELILIGDNHWGGISVVENSPLVQEVCNILDLVFQKNILISRLPVFTAR
jgi:hypothetical protein